MSSSSENDELTFSLSPSSSSSFSFRDERKEEEEEKKNFASPTTTLTPEEEEEEDEEETMEARMKRLECAMLESQKENKSLRLRVEQLEKDKKDDGERTTKEQKSSSKDLLELFSTRLANVKDTLREETKRAMDAAVGANAKVVKLLETLEACETEDGVVLYHRDVGGTGGGGGDETIDHKSRGEEEDEDERKKKRNEYVKEALDQIAEEVGYEDAMVLAARGGGSGTGFASTVSSKRNGKYYRWVKILFAILWKALQLWVCMWILIVAAVLADDITLRENVSGDFWAKFPWVSKGLVTNNFVGLASL